MFFYCIFMNQEEVGVFKKKKLYKWNEASMQAILTEQAWSIKELLQHMPQTKSVLAEQSGNLEQAS